jgi:hypothetical protein
MVWIGVHPNTFLKKMEPSVKHLLTMVNGGAPDRTPVLASGAGPLGSDAQATPPRSLTPDANSSNEVSR